MRSTDRGSDSAIGFVAFRRTPPQSPLGKGGRKRDRLLMTIKDGRSRRLTAAARCVEHR